jgi:hypothetical protein
MIWNIQNVIYNCKSCNVMDIQVSIDWYKEIKVCSFFMFREYSGYWGIMNFFKIGKTMGSGCGLFLYSLTYLFINYTFFPSMKNKLQYAKLEAIVTTNG